MNILYKAKNGKLYLRFQLEEAFLITTGQIASENEREFMLWMNSIWGKWIVETIRPESLSVEKLLCTGNKILAIKVYKEKNGCTLLEAKQAIDKIVMGE